MDDWIVEYHPWRSALLLVAGMASLYFSWLGYLDGQTFNCALTMAYAVFMSARAFTGYKITWLFRKNGSELEILKNKKLLVICKLGNLDLIQLDGKEYHFYSKNRQRLSVPRDVVNDDFLAFVDAFNRNQLAN